MCTMGMWLIMPTYRWETHWRELHHMCCGHIDVRCMLCIKDLIEHDNSLISIIINLTLCKFENL